MDLLRRPISEECSAVAFYGIEPSPAAGRRFLELVLNLMEKARCTPDKLGIEAPGHSGKMNDYRREYKKLEGNAYIGATNIELNSLLEGSSGCLGDFLITANWSAGASTNYTIAVARSSILALDSECFRKFCLEIIDILKPTYGIGYQRKKQYGPDWYALGVVQSPILVAVGEEYEEQREISRWCDMAMPMEIYRQGVLRDVYPLNFLTEPHLRRPVGNRSLEKWILEDSTNGLLSRISEEVFLWEIEDCQIARMRDELIEAKTIFRWRNFLREYETWQARTKKQ